MLRDSNLVVWLDHIEKDDQDQVGKEAVKFGEMAKLVIPFPYGFVITTNAYHQFLLANNLLTITKPVCKIKESIMSKSLINEIFRAYKRLEWSLKDATVDIYSSFPKKKFKNVKGEANLIQSVKSLWSSFFESWANHYLSAIVVQKKISPSCSGIMFTIDHSRNDKTKIIIYEGNETGNHYEVSKKDLDIVSKVIKKSRKQVLTDSQIIDLATIGKKLQEHYYFPQEVHFVAEKSHVFITKTKQITYISSKFIPTKSGQSSKLQRGISNRKLLLKGFSAYPGIATGYLRIIRRPQDTNKLLPGDVAVVTSTKIKLNQAMKKARAVVVESKLHHLSNRSISPRFYGKPMIIATPNSCKALRDGIVATVNGTSGQIYL